MRQPLPKSWRGVRGPLSALRLELGRAGWVWETPFEFRDPGGTLHNLFRISDARLCQLFCLHRQRQLGSQLANQYFKSQNAVLPWVDPSAVQSFLNSADCDARQRCCVEHLFTRSILTMSDLQSMGYDTDGLCPVCRVAPDTLRHRLFECGGTEELLAARAAFCYRPAVWRGEWPARLLHIPVGSSGRHAPPPPKEGGLVDTGLFRVVGGGSGASEVWEDVDYTGLRRLFADQELCLFPTVHRRSIFGQALVEQAGGWLVSSGRGRFSPRMGRCPCIFRRPHRVRNGRPRCLRQAF